MSPRKEIRRQGNISLQIASERREVCAVAPSCWNHTSSSSSPNLGRRKFCDISQYRSEVSYCHTFFLQKVWTPHAKFDYSAPYSYTGAMQRTFVKFTSDIYRPVSKVLFVYGATQMKMRLVAKQHNSCTGDVLLNFLTQGSAGFSAPLT